MTEEVSKKKEIPKKGDSINVSDYASERLVGLKNSEQRYMNNIVQVENDLKSAKADLIACRARIDEVTRLIVAQTKPVPEKS